ncbi:hypothetical protein FIBSPDRAFT_1040444 [Athelia psychrophila]|uniref:WW domain-containing protein n=1 Tax=Athelia psychrophila TaxID=1759441 RepID=A0A166QB15_9AGAM|nr:hypothetical protein FIBSPDRAFT_1040444 [Fibularhizoctonia sp. CBS 109695]
MSSPKLTGFLLRLLRYLISLAGGSIKGLLTFIGWIRQRLARNRDKHFRDPPLPPSDGEDTQLPSNPHILCPTGSAVTCAGYAALDVQHEAKISSTVPDDHPSHPPPILLCSNDTPVCPSFAPRAEHVTLDIPLHDRGDDNGGPYTTIIHPPSPTRSSFSGPGNAYAGSLSSRALSIEGASGSDTWGANSLYAVDASAAQPISTHGMQLATAGYGTSMLQIHTPSRSTSRNSGRAAEPIKISRPLTPPLLPPPPPITTPTGDAPSRLSSLENRLTIKPISTANVQRGKRGAVVSTEYNHCLVRAYSFEFHDHLAPPEGWAECHDPQGALYFFHAEKRIFTDVLLHDPTKAAIVNEAASQILRQFHREILDEKAVLPKECDLVLELVELDDQTVVGYYFADHASRLLFWMEEFDAWKICREVAYVVSFSHLRLEIESQYWMHYELYPNCRDYTTELRDEARGVLLHATASDAMASTLTTELWTMGQNSALLNIIEKLQVDYPADQVCAGAIVGRAMRNLKHTHFIQLFGQHGARLDHDETVPGMTADCTGFLRAIDIFLFWGTAVHLIAFREILVDGTVHLPSWRRYIQNLQSQWGAVVIAAPVLLNANIAFLSIQSVDNSGITVSNRSPAQILIYVSTVTSLSSMLFASFLLRQRDRKHEGSAAKFFENITHSNTGFQNLAILHAVPYALLIWSTLEFLGGFLSYCFSNTTSPTRAAVASALGGCIVLTVWCWTRLWVSESRQGRDYFENIEDWPRRMLKLIQPLTQPAP